jgi:rhomboid protease GluP
MDQPLPIASLPPGVVVVRRRYWPVATFIILAMNVVIFLLMAFAGGSTNPDVLLDFGASYAPYFHRGEYWRMVMPMFLHIGWMHLLVNSYALFVLGPVLERVYGYGRYASLYVAAGMGSSLLSMQLSNNIAAGASGAIFGVAGAMLVAGYLHREVVPARWGRAFGRGILPFIVLNLALGWSVKGIDNWGHLGGLLSGMLLAAVMPPPGHDEGPEAVQGEPLQVMVIVPLAVVALAMSAMVNHYRLSRDVTRLLLEGERLRGQRQAAQALERFREAARRAPHDERPHLELGSLYLEQKRQGEAIQEYNEALRLSPDSAPAQLGLAAAYRQKGDLARSQQFLEAALGKDPGTAEGHTALADLCAEQKLYQEAVHHYQEAVRLKPDLATAHNNLAWLWATSEDTKYRNPRGALEHALRAVELSHWKEPAYIDTLAEAHYANRNFAEAVKVQTKALQLDPDNPQFQEHMARYRQAAGV